MVREYEEVGSSYDAIPIAIAREHTSDDLLGPPRPGPAVQAHEGPEGPPEAGLEAELGRGRVVADLHVVHVLDRPLVGPAGGRTQRPDVDGRVDRRDLEDEQGDDGLHD